MIAYCSPGPLKSIAKRFTDQKKSSFTPKVLVVAPAFILLAKGFPKSIPEVPERKPFKAKEKVALGSLPSEKSSSTSKGPIGLSGYTIL